MFGLWLSVRRLGMPNVKDVPRLGRTNLKALDSVLLESGLPDLAVLLSHSSKDM